MVCFYDDNCRNNIPYTLSKCIIVPFISHAICSQSCASSFNWWRKLVHHGNVKATWMEYTFQYKYYSKSHIICEVCVQQGSKNGTLQSHKTLIHIKVLNYCGHRNKFLTRKKEQGGKRHHEMNLAFTFTEICKTVFISTNTYQGAQCQKARSYQ